jgi:hypothetical protein
MTALTLLFDEWFAQHRESCAVSRLDVSVECPVEGETKIHVHCPTCWCACMITCPLLGGPN